MSEDILPPAFRDLIPYVAEWSLAREQDRAVKRVSSDMGKLRAFQQVVGARMEAIIAHLNQLPNDPDTLPAADKRLFDLARMAMEASAPIDLEWSRADIEDVFPMERVGFSILPAGFIR
jgi:hypothetical protein